MKKSLQIFLNILGILFILFGSSAIIQAIIKQNAFQILWICYLSLIILGISIIKKNGYLLLSQLNIIFIPVLIWNLDFYYLLFTKQSLFGLTNYMFEYGGIFRLDFLISSQHFFTIPLSIIALYVIKTKHKNSWKLSLIEILSFFIITRLFTPASMNINLVFRSFYEPANNFISYPIYSILWPIGFLGIILLTNFIFTRKAFFKSKK